MSYRSFAPLAAAALMIASCRYQGTPPDGVVACQGNSGCPSGFRCLPRPGGDPAATFCCKTDSCGGAAIVDDAGAPDAAVPTDIARDLAADHAVVAADASPTGDDAADGPASDITDDAGRDGEAADVDVDVAVAAEAGLDVGPEVGADASPCASSSRGPLLVPAGGFCIDATEVTNAQYQAFLDAAVDVNGQGAACKWNTSFVPKGDQVSWPYPGGTSNHPVVNVDWCDAFAFCQWAGKRLCGKIGGGRLASVASATTQASQWISACNGHGRVTYPYGLVFDRHRCNTDATVESASFIEDVMHRLGCEGAYPGLWDMSGNVEEWIDACDKDAGSGDSCAVAGQSTYGGSLAPSAFGCADSTFGAARNTHYELLGFRCCSD